MRDLQPCLLTLAAASDLHVSERHTERLGLDFPEELSLAIFMKKIYNRFRPTAYISFLIFSIFQERNALRFHSPTLLTAVLLSDSRRDSTYCFGYQDRTPSWRTTQNECQPKNLELWWGQREESRIFIALTLLISMLFHFFVPQLHLSLVCVFFLWYCRSIF